MSVNSSLRSYDDCIELFDRALRSADGIWVEAPNRGSATQLKTRLNYCRQLLRIQSCEIYQPGEPEYGVSPYEELSVTIRDRTVFIQRQPSLGWPTGEISEVPSQTRSGVSSK